MPWRKEQLTSYLNRDRIPSQGVLLERGKTYLGRVVPDGYFRIQDWCVSQGISESFAIPDLTWVLQGVEYLLQAGTGNFPDKIVLTTANLIGTMHYLNRETVFDGGALRQYPELLAMVKEELGKLPRGKDVIRGLGRIPQYKDLFGE